MGYTLVVTAEFLKCTDTRKHVRAKFTIICAFFISLEIFYKVLSNLLCFIAILVYNSAQHYFRQSCVCIKQFTFRRSAVTYFVTQFTLASRHPTVQSRKKEKKETVLKKGLQICRKMSDLSTKQLLENNLKIFKYK